MNVYQQASTLLSNADEYESSSLRLGQHSIHDVEMHTLINTSTVIDALVEHVDNAKALGASEISITRNCDDTYTVTY